MWPVWSLSIRRQTPVRGVLRAAWLVLPGIRRPEAAGRIGRRAEMRRKSGLSRKPGNPEGAFAPNAQRLGSSERLAGQGEAGNQEAKNKADIWGAPGKR